VNKPERLTDEDRRAREARGLRAVEIWVPDLSRPEVREALEREVEEIRRADQVDDIMAFVESVSVLNDLPPYDGPDYS
jgi:hypothetical protein